MFCLLLHVVSTPRKKSRFERYFVSGRDRERERVEKRSQRGTGGTVHAARNDTPATNSEEWSRFILCSTARKSPLLSDERGARFTRRTKIWKIDRSPRKTELSSTFKFESFYLSLCFCIYLPVHIISLLYIYIFVWNCSIQSRDFWEMKQILDCIYESLKLQENLGRRLSMWIYINKRL